MPHRAFPPVAIVGIGGIFPDALNVEEFWQNIKAGRSVAREVPEGRWTLPVADVYDPQRGPDRVYSKYGCYLPDFQVDLHGLQFAPDVLMALDPVFHVALYAARQAVQDAKLSNADLRRAGVFIGNIALPTDTTSALTAEIFGSLFEERLGHVMPSFFPTTHPLNRYVFGMAAGVIAQALGFGGGSYALDAACASSLYAVKFAVDELQAGRADVMLSGGVSRPDALYTQMGFCQLNALSPTGVCAPFDANGNGLVVGEGAGMVVLKRLEDALRDGNQVYAVIRGIGLSNDRQGALLAPDSEGQIRAMRAAYEQAGWTPNTVDLIECHATGTPIGDVVEFTSLRELWKDSAWQREQCVIGSVKSNIGHLLTGAGAAGLIKTLLALKHATLPPTANFVKPGPNVPLSQSPFKVLRTAEPWRPHADGSPRRAAVSAFGFGGINAHVLLEEWLPPVRPSNGRGESVRPLKRPVEVGENDTQIPIAVVGMGAHIGPWPTLQAFQERVLGNTTPVEPALKKNWWGIEASTALQERGIHIERFKGFYIDHLNVPFGKFRIPPKELEETLPQQILMLQVVAEALEDVQSATNLSSEQRDALRLRTGVFVGTGLDFNTTNFSFRWLIQKKARQWAAELGLNLTEQEFQQWVRALRDSVSPPLTANRTVGALGGIVASRVAREFHVGGPSFALSSEDGSGLRALEVAVRALQRGELDRAIVGAVDLAGDIRALLTTHAVRPFSTRGLTLPFDAEADGSVPGEGAVAIILKRLPDAQRDNDRIYAVIRGIGAASGESAYGQALERAYAEAAIPPAQVAYLETHGSGVPSEDTVEAAALSAFFGQSGPAAHAIGSVKADIGHTGAASGLCALVKTCLCLYHQILPPIRTLTGSVVSLLNRDLFYTPSGPQYWLRNRIEGPRRAGISSASIDGNYMHVVLEAYESVEEAAFKAERIQPLGIRNEALLAIGGNDQAELVTHLQHLQRYATEHRADSIEALACAWWQRQAVTPENSRAAAFVARSSTELLEQMAALQQALSQGTSPVLPGNRVFYTDQPVGATGAVAFVYPGSGNHYPGMGREISAQWPDILRQQDQQNQWLRRQYVPELLWNTASLEEINRHPRDLILGQVAYGTLMTDLLQAFAIRPQAIIGYSLGESTGFFAARAWVERDEMLSRMLASPLFTNDLAGADLAARKAWNLKDDEAVDWMIAALQCPADTVRRILAGRERVYLLIINTPGACVIGGNRQAVLAVIAALGCQYHPLYGVSTAHCEVLTQVAEPYRQLHWFNSTRAPEGVRFYSGVWGRAYDVTPDSAAEAILAQASSTINFPAVITQAYADGIRVFVEIGPGTTCARMIGEILAGKPHVARSACTADYENVSTILRLLGVLIAERVPVNLDVLYGKQNKVAQSPELAKAPRMIEIPIGRGTLTLPPLPVSQVRVEQLTHSENTSVSADGANHRSPGCNPGNTGRSPALKERFNDALFQSATPGGPGSQGCPLGYDDTALSGRNQELNSPALPGGEISVSLRSAPLRPVTAQVAVTNARNSEAQAAYLKYAQGITDSFAKQAAFQMTLFEAAKGSLASIGLSGLNLQPSATKQSPETGEIASQSLAMTLGDQAERAVFMNRAQCLEFAIGSIAKVLGDRYADVDAYPTRVRLPAEPLMLVDRIISVTGEPCSLTHGAVVTEHDILPGDWYLDCGRIPTCIAVESGQADLFLSGYLGIDLQTKGLAVYRLLDAIVTFHDDLPGPGKVIRYEITIEHFFRQGATYLFHFNFEGTVDGKPFLSMRDGCAGFFTQQELDSGQGIVFTTMDLQSLPGKLPEDWQPLVTMQRESYSDEQIEALRRGDLAGCFGELFAGLPLREPSRLPGGRMHLIDRVLALDPQGGRYGLGLIQAEADIHPDDWFLTCHFVDDQVMPGTLMYECSLHALRVLLMRMGWVGEQDEIAWEPVPEVPGQLKCRGQVLASTQKVMYEVSIKEIGFRPEPYAIADALMLADGKPIVRMLNMSLRMSGARRAQLEQIWTDRNRSPVPDLTGFPKPVRSPMRGRYDQKPAIFDSDSILAFAIGKPSEAFGDRYVVFDEERVIARLPGPPYKFLDRITALQGEQWVLTAGKVAEAQYDIPPNEWYFAANRQATMPFSILLEVALQPCGWLAAYAGSALTSEVDLSFRNLGGQATQFLPVTPDTGTLTTTVKMTSVSQSGGMIIQHYDMDLRNTAGEPVYQGTTYFGFFTKAALANQIGLREAHPYQPTPAEQARGERFAYPQEAPFPGPQLRMIDEVTLFVPDGGPHGLGFIWGVKTIIPEEWFFKAHFFQDPVWPGSLGLEAFLQLMKVVAVKRWGWQPGDTFDTMALNRPHAWTYRGQVIPTDREVTVQAVVTACDDTCRFLEAEGFLIVDERIIYQMEHFSLTLNRAVPAGESYRDLLQVG